mmetsp:Transcript_2523/g.6253  ORF Transcript_2523/g.6253 Transcript_2523/m.6253 type:complete len:303 (-) Transcript_2523:44-952(-)
MSGFLRISFSEYLRHTSNSSGEIVLLETSRISNCLPLVPRTQLIHLLVFTPPLEMGYTAGVPSERSLSSTDSILATTYIVSFDWGSSPTAILTKRSLTTSAKKGWLTHFSSRSRLIWMAQMSSYAASSCSSSSSSSYADNPRLRSSSRSAPRSSSESTSDSCSSSSLRAASRSSFCLARASRVPERCARLSRVFCSACSALSLALSLLMPRARLLVRTYMASISWSVSVFPLGSVGALARLPAALLPFFGPGAAFCAWMALRRRSCRLSRSVARSIRIISRSSSVILASALRSASSLYRSSS